MMMMMMMTMTMFELSAAGFQWSHVLNVLHPGTKQGNAYAIAYVFSYAHTSFAYAHILSYAELALAYAHQSLAYATPLQGAPS
jgi:hypothetical protein